MTIPVEVVIGLLGFLTMLVLGVISAVVVSRKDAQADGRERGSIGQKLDNVLKMLSEVVRDITEIKQENSKTRERVVRVETKVDMNTQDISALFDKVRCLEKEGAQ